MSTRRLINLVSPALFICDLQEKFRPAIWKFAMILTTTQKMLKASNILNFPVFVTTQKRTSLGETCSELALDRPGGTATAVNVDKSSFSMWVPDVQSALSSGPHQVAIVGIESHVCVTQTTLDLLQHGHKVYVLADGVSSCNKEEVPIALRRLADEGAVVTTSESFLYECMGGSGLEEFMSITSLVKESKLDTMEALQALCKI